MTLHLYILRQLVVALAFAVGGMGLIAVPGLAISAVHNLGGAGLPAVLRFLPILGAELLPYLLPLGFLLSAVSVFGRMASDGEWTALCMAGVRPAKMLLLPGLFALGLSAGTLWLLSEVSPGLKDQKARIVKNAVLDALKTKYPGRTSISAAGFQLIGQYRDGDDMREVFIQIPEYKDQAAVTAFADRVRLDMVGDNVMRLELFNGRVVQRGESTLRARFERMPIELQLNALFQPRSGRRRAKHKPTTELLADLREGRVQEKKIIEHQFEIHRRAALSATFLMFLLLGAPTGLLLRRGTQLGAMTAAVGYGLVYYLLSLRLGRGLAQSGVWPVPLAAWMTNILGFISGLWLCWRAFRR